MAKIAFKDLVPVPVIIGGEKHMMSPAQYAKICMCAVKGTGPEIKEQIAIGEMVAEMGEEQTTKFLETLGQFKQQYEGNVMNFSPIEKPKAHYDPSEAFTDAEMEKFGFSGTPQEIKRASIEFSIGHTLKKIEPVIRTDRAKKIELPAKEFIRICECGAEKTLNKLVKLQDEWNNA